MRAQGHFPALESGDLRRPTIGTIARRAANPVVFGRRTWGCVGYVARVRSVSSRPGERDGRATEFEGVSIEHGRGIRDGVGPYEFFTPDGAHVYLHDADFLGLVWLPDATLRFFFSYDGETAPLYGAKDTPVIELSFFHVELHAWETDIDALAEAEHHGQVSTFSWDNAHGFDMVTYALHVSFAAARMQARLLASVPHGLE